MKNKGKTNEKIEWKTEEKYKNNMENMYM